MRQINKMINKKCFLTLFLITFGSIITLHAQRTITGEVTDENEQPLPGATITIEGKEGVGTITDIDGSYSIEVESEDSLLVFQFLGYQRKEIHIGNNTNIDVTLIPAEQSLDEVVVVGYGTQKKRSITGSVGVVDMDEFSQGESVTVSDRLQGRVPGVQVTSSGEPGSTGDVKIRGIGFLNNNDPLYVVDGVLLDNSPNINPNDIESIQVLKDASSTAIYGSRAANGVIEITTKKGEKGAPRISFTANASLQSLPNKIETVNSARWGVLDNSAKDNGGFPRQALAENPPDFTTDWHDAVYNNQGLLQDINLSISGGGDKHNAYFSVNNAYQEGIIEGPRFDRTTMRLNSDYTFSDRITVGENFSVGRSRLVGLSEYFEGESNPIADIYEMLPVIPVYDPTQPSGYGIGEVGRALTLAANPVAMTDMFKNRSTDYVFIGDVYADVNIFEGLDYHFSVGIDKGIGKNKSYNKAGRIRVGTDHESGLEEFRYDEQTVFLENRLTYAKSLDKHNFSFMVAHTEQETNSDFQSAESDGGYDEEPYIWQISASTANIISAGGESSWALRSYLGRFTYDFDERYFLTGILRRDGSSNFAKERRWGNFPSISAGWDISKEGFFNIDLISHLKLRVGYGEVGSATEEPYRFQSTVTTNPQEGVSYYFGANEETRYYGSSREADDIVNRDITWQTLKETNLGIDLELDQGKFLFSGDYYQGTMEDLLTELPIPGTIGAPGEASPFVNAVSMKRNGYEIAITYRDVIGDFKYNVSANGFHLNNEVTELPYGVTELGGGSTREGQPVGQNFLLEYKGIYTQSDIDNLPEGFTILGQTPVVGDAKYSDINGRDEDGNLTGEPDNKISEDDDRKIIGNPVPYLQYGLNFDASYRNYFFSVFFQGVTKRDVYNSYYANLNTAGANTFTADFDPYINGEGTEPRLVAGESGNNLPSSRFIENGAYFRLKNLQIGYNIPLEPFQEFKVFISGQNLLTFTEYRGLDPEFEGGIFSRGFDPMGYPNVRTLSAGLNITF